jgi:hypothetical protein
MLRRVVLAAVRHELGEAWGTARLEAWLDGPWERAFHDISRLLFEAHDQAEGEPRLRRRLEALGLQLPEGKIDEVFEASFSAFVAERLAALLDPPPGEPPYDARSLFVPDGAGERPVERLLEAAVQDVFGSSEAFDVALGAALDDITSAYSGQMTFEATVEVPGRVLRTSGALGEGGRVHWRFRGDDVARTGYALVVESVIARPDRLARVHGAKPSLDVPEMLRILDLLEGATPEEREALAAAFDALTHEEDPGAAVGRFEEPLRERARALLAEVLEAPR